MSIQPKPEIVVIGGGIIGCTAAYYLSQKQQNRVTLLEASKYGIAQGASGKAGGLVAKWAYPKELVNVSFREHVRLAEDHGGASRWGWRYVNCGSWEGRGEVIDKGTGGLGSSTDDGPTKNRSLEKTQGLTGSGAAKETHVQAKKKGLPDDLTWVSESLTDSYSPMAVAGDTAQVYPYQFTSSMLQLAQDNGVELVAAQATSILMDGTTVDGLGRKVTGVEYRDLSTGATTTIPASHVILAAGARSPRLLSHHNLPISTIRAHSITLQPRGQEVTVAPYVLFTEIKPPHGLKGNGVEATPEIYARPNNEVYACGPGDDSPLPDVVDDVEVDQAACDSILEHVSSISVLLREATVDKRQACFLPLVSMGGGPIIGEATKIAKGLIIATGHTCWGICNAPGTAKAVSELVEFGEIQCANLKRLHPSIFIRE